ncbi:hypothetical protein ACF0H5_004179 [Mactra antiquata]
MRACFVLASLAVVFWTNQVNGYTCNSNPHVNGCSIPGDLPYFYKNVFNSDCNKHDICYACGERKGVSRSDCDSRFYARIKHTCETDSSVSSETWCKMVTFDYYAAVRIGGSSHYHSPSQPWCSDSWVTSCI